MKTKTFLAIAGFVIAFVAISCLPQKSDHSDKENQTIIPAGEALEAAPQKYVDERLGIYAPFTLTADLSHLSENEKEIIKILYDVAKIMDGLYWKQTIGKKDDFLARISNENAYSFAMINYGPWDRLNNNKPFQGGP